jgi:hypothetical protein
MFKCFYLKCFKTFDSPFIIKGIWYYELVSRTALSTLSRNDYSFFCPHISNQMVQIVFPLGSTNVSKYKIMHEGSKLCADKKANSNDFD